MADQWLERGEHLALRRPAPEDSHCGLAHRVRPETCVQKPDSQQRSCPRAAPQRREDSTLEERDAHGREI